MAGMPDMGSLELPEGPEAGPEEPTDLAMGDEMLGELDPQFAADAAEAFPDLDDAQLTALQRAIQGLLGK